LKQKKFLFFRHLSKTPLFVPFFPLPFEGEEKGKKILKLEEGRKKAPLLFFFIF